MKVVTHLIEPVPKPRMTQRDKWKKRPCVMRYRAFKDKVRLSRVKLPEGATVTFVMPMPKSWSKDKRDRTLYSLHRQKPDIDNLAKALLDALYGDDSHVAQLRLQKRWGVEGKIVIEIEDGKP